MTDTLHAEVVVLGSGPGGYSAAFRAADLGKKVIDDAADVSTHGVEFGKPKLDINKIRDYKNSIIKKLTGGLAMMAKQRGVQIVTGYGEFTDSKKIIVTKDNKKTEITFDNCIIAAGSLPVKLPFIPDDPRVLDSTSALELGKTDGEMLILGGGIIGLEMATVYHALGSKISVVEMLDQLIPGADRDVVMPLHKRLEKRYQSIMLKTSVTKVEAKKDGLWVTFDGENVPKENPKKFDRILVAVGRRPNGKLIGAEKAGVKVDERGFIPVDHQLKTNVAGIYAIGDIAGNPMLAHKASSEAHIAAEVIAGKKHYFEPKCIPSVAYTDPEIAWAGMTESQAAASQITVQKAVFPWAASGRALSIDRTEGFTKLIFDDKRRIVGGAIVGVNAGELISEIALAIEMGCDVEDIALTIHPHPTLSESIKMAAEVFEGTVTDLYIPKKK